MGNAIELGTTAVALSAQVGVECPLCHWKQWVNVTLEKPQMNHPLALEMRRHLEAWMASHCPDHLNAIPAMSKN